MKKKKETIFIYGKHALVEALVNKPEAVRKVYLAPEAGDEHMRRLLREKNIPTAPLTSREEKDMKEKTHQGVIGVLDQERLTIPYEQFIDSIHPSKETALVLLDEIQDPHNVGAIIRSAAAFGARAVFLPSHRQAGITGAVIKVSAGMAFRIPVVTIGNVNTVVRDLKERGFWIYGLERTGKTSLETEMFEAPSVFIFGNESEGIRLKTKELCDALLSIPIQKGVESLNVAASAAVTLYAWSRRRS